MLIRKNQPEGPAVFMRSVGLVAVRHSRSCLLTAKTEEVVGHERQESKGKPPLGLYLITFCFPRCTLCHYLALVLTSLNWGVAAAVGIGGSGRAAV